MWALYASLSARTVSQWFSFVRIGMFVCGRQHLILAFNSESLYLYRAYVYYCVPRLRQR